MEERAKEGGPTFVVESGAPHLVLLVVASLSLCPWRLSQLVGGDGTLGEDSMGESVTGSEGGGNEGGGGGGGGGGR